ncbi:pantothenate kinase [Alkalihalobacillus alcalophilus ATCC 27647 = CGMCC 1.3604]|uniref:Pantothenate kinase n=2 Tax=Alkalihalobacillus alcalophilus ATCC 27647 = CGMCC 1.3604 TaxID=1218173 RepID=A0A4S4JVQ5_ALKAL|nr:type I pantothenate kinase [Alkalihalobacillus alcalophilus]MED1561178.1 type I pantothenate kinase [Alkalihalobacillus alcalophilus]THG89263.1 pantothenate kinase [Alkalihalobacillus alcalophilus ATCC 27647 = CGMCC 1.3604]
MTINLTMKSTEAYSHFNRQEWSALAKPKQAALSKQEIELMQGIDQIISPDEVTDIYLPLSHMLYIQMTHSMNLHHEMNLFLNRTTKKVPFVIGIAGSVSVGKSTTARLIQALISQWPTKPKVDLVTTDGFLLPNATLNARNLMKKKGFPESYDIERLIHFLTDLKSGSAYMEVPMYSHLTYDRLQNEVQKVEEPDVVIVEGINVLQVNKKKSNIPEVFVSDFFDYSIYVDADEMNIKQWYIERFKLLQNTAFQDPSSYFHRYRDLSPTEAVAFATDIWNTVNKVNLEKNIKPTKYRANMILKKGPGHRVSDIQIKKT